MDRKVDAKEVKVEDGDASDGGGQWQVVTGKRVARGKQTSAASPSIKSAATLLKFAGTRANLETVATIIANVSNAAKHLARVEAKLVQVLMLHCPKPRRIIALGCGSPSGISIGLGKSSQFQWAAILLLKNAWQLPPESIEIYDPVMTIDDCEAWNKLNTMPLEPIKMPNVPKYHQDDDKECQVLLWMPHCEAPLYNLVVQAMLRHASPLDAAMGKSPHESPDYALENALVVGNAPETWLNSKSDLNVNVQVAKSIKLPYTTSHPQAFNNTFINSFK